MSENISAQGSSNPFDLQHRVRTVRPSSDTASTKTNNPFNSSVTPASSGDSKNEGTDDPSTTEDVLLNPSTNNPFDIRRSPIRSAAEPSTDVISMAPISKPDIKRENTRGGFIFWTLLLMVIFLALMVTLYRSVISKVYRAFSNENFLKLLQREQGGIVKPPYWFLYLLFTVNGGIFLFLMARNYAGVSDTLSTLLFCIAGVSLFFFAKHLVLKFIESVFPFKKSIKQYSFTIVIFSIVLGLILIPFNIFIAFAPENLLFAGIVLALLTILIVYLFRFLRSVMISTKYLMFHKFHFFMYLCTIEIAPLLIVLKLILNGVYAQ